MKDNRLLIIRIGNDGISFSTLRDGTMTFEPYTMNSSISAAANMRQALQSATLPKEQFERVLVMTDTPVLMMPADLFDEDSAETLYHHAFTKGGQVTVIHSILPDLHAVALYALPKDLTTVLCDAFVEVRYTPAMAPVWRHMHQRSYTGQHRKLYACYHDRRVDVFSFAQNRFVFCNSYDAQRSDDVLYYVLAAWKTLALDAGHDELFMMGDFPDREHLVDRAREFVKRVFYINPSGEFNRASVTQIAGMSYDLMTLYVKGR